MKIRFAMMFLILPLTLLSIAGVLFGREGTPRPNPFVAYSQWMPGNPVPQEDCSRLEYGMPRELSYVFCELKNNPDFRAVRIMGANNTITTTYFYPIRLTYGDLVNWYGYPARYQRGRSGQYATWARLQMGARKSAGRYNAPLIVVWFREETRKK